MEKLLEWYLRERVALKLLTLVFSDEEVHAPCRKRAGSETVVATRCNRRGTLIRV